MARPNPESIQNFPHFLTIPTRWMDNDVYQHINNVIYYSFFDTAVNHYLIDRGLLDIKNGTIIGLVVETHCNYFSPIEFPEIVRAGLRVSKIGNSSVRYEIGLFKADSNEATAQGHYVHVYVDREGRRPTKIPLHMREALENILVNR